MEMLMGMFLEMFMKMFMKMFLEMFMKMFLEMFMKMFFVNFKVVSLADLIENLITTAAAAGELSKHLNDHPGE